MKHPADTDSAPSDLLHDSRLRRGRSERLFVRPFPLAVAVLCLPWFAVGCAAGRTSPAAPQADAHAAPALAQRIDTGIGLTMIRIEPKPFMMGSPTGESGRESHETAHQVTISKPYWIGETEVTQAQWTAVMGATSWGGDNEKVGDRYPATSVSWTEALAFCTELTKHERAADRLPPGYEYTLPSEAEWEYACRGGSATAYCYGDDEGRLTDYAVFGKSWRKGNSADPVRTKQPNAFGLYDMHGNVGEWCADYADPAGAYQVQIFTDTYSGAMADPLSRSGSLRVVRGGSWGASADACRSAYRYGGVPSSSGDGMGFRPTLAARSDTMKGDR